MWTSRKLSKNAIRSPSEFAHPDFRSIVAAGDPFSEMQECFVVLIACRLCVARCRDRRKQLVSLVNGNLSDALAESLGALRIDLVERIRELFLIPRIIYAQKQIDKSRHSSLRRSRQNRLRCRHQRQILFPIQKNRLVIPSG